MIEWLFFLLPLAAASGWWAAKRESASGRNRGAPDPDYFHGLNYLFDDQPDQAIDIFLKLAETNREAAEIQLALGGLFRRRGEVDRAIRVHQGLVARPRLGKRLRAFALYELGQDYLRAGLFDRAESLFGELVETEPHRRRALEGLREIYQQEKEWRKCLEVVHRLRELTGLAMAGEIAHYHCELAEEALRQGDLAVAHQCLREAEAEDPAGVRATLLQARLAREDGEQDRAIRLLRRAAAQDPRMLPEILPRWLELYRSRPWEEQLQALEEFAREHSGAALILALGEALRQTRGREAAVARLTDHVREYADLAVLERLLDLSESDRPLRVHRAVRQVVAHLHGQQPGYQCEHCGFIARRLHWQCPSCKHWGGILPVQPTAIAKPPS